MTRRLDGVPQEVGQMPGHVGRTTWEVGQDDDQMVMVTLEDGLEAV